MRSTAGKLIIFLLPVVVVIMGQGCTNNLKFISDLPSLSVTSESGNGGTYDGKLIIVHHNQDGFTCEGHQSPKSILLRRPNMQWYYTENSSEKCRTINELPVQEVAYDEGARKAVYKGNTYLPPQLFKVVATEDPNLPDAYVEDGVCATTNGACSVRAAFDQIVPMNFAASVEVFIPKGIYKLTSQIVVLNENPIRITGEDRATTVLDGGSTNRIFEMYSTGSNGLGNLQISNLTFANARIAGTLSWGGAMMISYRNNDVKIDNCHFEGNRAEQAGGGLSIHGNGSGVATVSRSTFRNNSIFSTNPNYYRGDAIYASGSLVLEDSMIHENGLVGANTTTVYLNFNGPFWLKNSSIVNNLSNGTAYLLNSCTVSPCQIDNSTIAKNNGVGLGFSGGPSFDGSPPPLFKVQNSTIAQNNQGGGSSGIANIWINTIGDFELNNLIIAAANPAVDKNCSISGNILNSSRNVINDASCTSSPPQEPLLEPLANNGGFGLTMKPMAGSPALNMGTNCLPIDQRHVARTDYANSCDIGAVEVP